MNATKKVIFTAIIVFIFTLIYFILGSKQVYTQKAPIIPTYYPIGIILGIIVIAVLNRYFIKGGGSYTVISSVVLVMFLFAFTFAMDFLYRPILSDYYRSGPATLINLARYEGQKGNYITIHKQMLKEGVFAHSIAEGYSDQDGRLSETYTDPITYHVNSQYIIFDWNTKKLIKKEDQDAVAKAAYDYLVKEKNISQGQLSAYYFNGCNVDIEADDKYYNVFVYAKDGEFAYALNE